MKRLSTETKKGAGANMFYQVVFWKKIDDNEESKKDFNTIVAFAQKTGFGITNIKLTPEQQPQYYQQPEYIPEAEVEPEVDPQ